MIKITQGIEEWKSIEGCSNYMISNTGKVKNINRDKLLRGGLRQGYLSHTIKADSGKTITVNTHIIVARAFVPNNDPENKTMVNHINEDKTDAHYTNLEWVTAEENANHGTRNKRIGEAMSKPVNEYDTEGKYIRTWKNACYPAEVIGVTPRLIQAACLGKTITACGRQWRYLKADDINNIDPVKNKHALSYKKNARYNIKIPNEYLYTVEILDEAEQYADTLDGIISSMDIPMCFIQDLKKIKGYLLKATS